MTAAYRTEPCKSCSGPVIWAVTATRRAMPVDAEPSPGGNVALNKRGLNGQARPFAYVVPVLNLQAARDEGTPLRTSHFVTCPDAPSWRKPKAATT